MEPFYSLMHFFLAFSNFIKFYIVKGLVVRTVISAFGPWGQYTIRTVFKCVYCPSSSQLLMSVSEKVKEMTSNILSLSPVGMTSYIPQSYTRNNHKTFSPWEN